MTDQATLLRRYHMALSESRTDATLRRLDATFWVDHMPVDFPSPPASFESVFTAHRERIAGRGSPALCDQALQTALRSIVGQ